LKDTSLDSVFDAESEKNILRSIRKAESKIYGMFWKKCVF
jgi:hypothetical protein